MRLASRVAALAWSVLLGATLPTSRTTAANEQPDTRPPFTDWLEGVRKEALARGIQRTTVDAALTGLEPLPNVLERDRSQAEVTFTLDQYLQRRVTRKTVATARESAARYQMLLRRVAAQYGVPERVIVAIWGIESNFGQNSGAFPTLAALATLAYDPRRATRFREELFQALAIVDRGDIEVDRMKGSWAGAMGQPQFLPSSYMQFAVDFDGDERRDIWSSRADVFASIANYLKGHGWSKDLTWGRAVRVSPAVAAKIADSVPSRRGDCSAMRQMTEPLPLTRWRQLGVTRADGKPLPTVAVDASLFRAGGGQNFLLYRNYDALLAYNCAHTYGLTVALLSDRIR